MDHILAINRTNIEIQREFLSLVGEPPEAGRLNWPRQEKLQKDIGRLTESARRASGWSDPDGEEQVRCGQDRGPRQRTGALWAKAAKLMQRSKSIQRRREEAVEEEAAAAEPGAAGGAGGYAPALPDGCAAGGVQDVAVCYNGRRVCREITFEVLAGERIALQGANGCGEVQPAEAAAGGRDPPQRHGGDHERPGGVLCQPEYGPPAGQPDGVCPDPGSGRQPVRTILRKLDVPREQFEKDLADYSSGQKKKVLLAASLCNTGTPVRGMSL